MWSSKVAWEGTVCGDLSGDTGVLSPACMWAQAEGTGTKSPRVAIYAGALGSVEGGASRRQGCRTTHWGQSQSDGGAGTSWTASSGGMEVVCPYWPSGGDAFTRSDRDRVKHRSGSG